MEYRKYLEDVSLLTDTVILLAAIALIAIPSAYRVDANYMSLALAILSVLTTSGAIVLSWINLKKSKSPKQHRARLSIMIAIPLVLLATLTISTLAVSSWRIGPVFSSEVKATATDVEQITQDPTLIATLQALGVKEEYEDLSLIVHAGDMSRPCGLSNSLACYRKDPSGSSSITISKRAYQLNHATILAHEFLHYAWQKYDLEKDNVLTSHLIDLYAKQPGLQDQMSSHYVESGGLNPDEIFSHACTTLNDQQLGGYIASKCSVFIDLSNTPSSHLIET